MNKNILITGGSGLLGHFWINSMLNSHNIYIAFHKRILKSKRLNPLGIPLIDANQIAEKINKYKIDIVINLAGISNVDKCERNPELAYEVNQKLAKIIAQACYITGVKLIHISTDHLYGDFNKLHSEEDKIVLLNHYAKSKYAGECDVLNECPNALVCRTNFFGSGPAHRESFSDWIIRSLKNGESLFLFDDVFFSPLLGSLVPIYAHKLIDLNASGIFNLSADDAITKYKFGDYICKYFNFPENLIKKASLRDRSDLARRPLSMGLLNNKACKLLGAKFGNVSDHIVLLLKKK